MKHHERDGEIMRRYTAGEPISALCKSFKLTRGRIYQILKGVRKERRTATDVPRDMFLGINVSESVKDALLIEANRRGVSMSSLSSKTLREMLVACGYELEAEQVEVGK